MISHPVFSGIRDTRSLALYVMFCRSLFVLFVYKLVLMLQLEFSVFEAVMINIVTYLFSVKPHNGTSVPEDNTSESMYLFVI